MTTATKTTKTKTPKAKADRVERIVAASAEWKAWKEWNADRSGPEPATPNLDAVRASEETTNNTNQKERKMAAPKVKMTYYRNGEPMPERYNYLADLASRSGTSAREITEKLNGQLPKASTWFMQSPKGFMIGGVVDGDDVPPELLEVVESDTAKPEPKKAKKAPKAKPQRSVKIVQHGKQSFGVEVDGEQVGRRVSSKAKAEKLMAELS